MTVPQATSPAIEPDPVEVERQVARLLELHPADSGGYYAAACGSYSALTRQLAALHVTSCPGQDCATCRLLRQMAEIGAALDEVERLVGEEGRA